MPFVLRQIRKSKWYKNENVQWLSEGELQADALVDLKTEDNVLSIWLIEDDRSNLERVIAALATRRNTLANLDYALVDLRLLVENGFKFRQTDGATPDSVANSWHRDIIELSATKLVDLARTIQLNGSKERTLAKRMQQLIEEAVVSGRLDRQKIDEQLRAKLGL